MDAVRVLCGQGDLLFLVLDFLRVPDQVTRSHHDQRQQLRDLVALGHTSRFFHGLLFVEGEATSPHPGPIQQRSTSNSWSKGDVIEALWQRKYYKGTIDVISAKERKEQKLDKYKEYRKVLWNYGKSGELKTSGRIDFNFVKVDDIRASSLESALSNKVDAESNSSAGTEVLAEKSLVGSSGVSTDTGNLAADGRPKLKRLLIDSESRRLHAGKFDVLFGRGGKCYWKNLHVLKELVTQRIPLPTATTPRASLPFPSLRILSEKKETDSLSYYREGRHNAEWEYCSGYFGFAMLSNGEVAVWGDFSGLAFYADADAFLSPPRDEGGGEAKHGKEHNGREEGRGNGRDNRPYGTMFSSYRLQVMAVLVHNEHAFLGFANGDIDCVRLPTRRGAPALAGGRAPVAATPADQVEYPYVSGSTGEHRNEVTTLAAVGARHLASGSLLSPEVLVHWNALVDGDLTGPSSRVHYDVESVMAITSTPLSFDLFQSSSLVAVGSSDGTVFYSSWDDPEERQERTRQEWLKFHDVVPIPPSVEGHVSFLAFLENQLVIGTNMGSLVVMNRDILLDGHKYTLQDCCGTSDGGSRAGCVVEDVKLIGGSVLLTAGGCRGDVRFWDWDTGRALCRWVIHSGRTVGRSVLRSCVVAAQVCHERSSLIALCQDGFVRECRLNELSAWSKRAPPLVPRKKRKKSVPPDEERLITS